MNFRHVFIALALLIIFFMTGIFFMTQKNNLSFTKASSILTLTETNKLLSSNFNSQENNKKDFDKVFSRIGTPPDMQKSFLTGKAVNNESKRIFVAMIDNHRSARWHQQGIENAKIFFEMPAEGGIPRIAAIFTFDQDLEKIGPIRSIRPYFLSILKPFYPLVAHAGGSDEALKKIALSKVFCDLDNELGNSSFFWREDDLKKPHNLFISSQKIRDFAQQEKWHKKIKNPVFTFDEIYLKGKEVKKFKVNFGLKKDLVIWKWNGEKQIFSRWQDNQKPDINVKNVIIIVSNQWLLGDDDKYRIGIETTGKGKAFVFRNGKMIAVNWQRKEGEFFRFFDTEKKEIPLALGKTFFEFINEESKLEVDS